MGEECVRKDDHRVEVAPAPLPSGFTSAPSFSAVLLAGGASRRMGRDKALLIVPGTGHLLWQRQWKLLEELRPAELLWSGPPRENMPEKGRVVSDVVPGAGPLAGISACLDILQSDLLVVLAVDLPRMTSGFVRGLLAQCAWGIGTVVQRGDFYEPLTAVYPKHLQGLASRHLAEGRYALQDFIAEAIGAESLRPTVLSQDDEILFQNLNAPSDLAAWNGGSQPGSRL